MKTNISHHKITASKDKSDIDNVISCFVRLLAKNNQLKKGPVIIENFSKIWDQTNSIVKVKIESAYPLNEGISDEIKRRVKKKYDAKEIIIINKINKNIKGGVIIKIGDTVIDGSVKRQFETLRKTLKT